MRRKIEEAFIPVLNNVRCLDKHVTGNIKLASMLVDALPTEVQKAIERDTPKKPIFPTIKEQSEDREDMPRCPDCVNNMDKVIGRARQSHSSHGVIRTVEYNLYGWNVQPFCPECGQRLDWGEE